MFLKCLESVIKLAKLKENNRDPEFIIDTVKEVYYFTLHKGTSEDETFVEWLLEKLVSYGTNKFCSPDNWWFQNFYGEFYKMCICVTQEND